MEARMPEQFLTKRDRSASAVWRSGLGRIWRQPNSPMTGCPGTM